MNLSELRNHPTYKLLTPNEAKFLEEYLENGDWHDAVSVAYPDSKRKDNISKQLQTRPFVVQMIRQIDGIHLPTKEELIAEGWSAALANDGAAKVSALQFVAKLSGHLDSDKEDKPTNIADLMREVDNALKRR